MTLGSPARFVLLLLVVLHAGLALMYAANTPYRASGLLFFQGRAPAQDIGAPDERQHANFIQRLREGQGLPVFNPNDPNLYETYQSHQPPLYYFLAAGWSQLVGVPDVTAPEAGVRLRALNALLGAIGVAGVFFFVWWGFGRVEPALGAAAIAALLPMNLALSGAVSNDPLLIALCSWAMALLALAVRSGQGRAFVAAGVCVGLALATKTSALALFGAFLVALAMLARAQGEVRVTGKFLLIGAALAVAIPAGVWLRNLQLYGDPFAIRAFGDAFKGSAQASMFINELGPVAYWTQWVGWWTLRSFFGVFGYMDIFLPNPLYGVLTLSVVILAAMRYLGRTDPAFEGTRGVRIIGGVFAFLVLLFFIRFNTQYFQGQARYLLPAIAPIAATLGLGLLVLPETARKWGVGVVAAGLVALNLYVLGLLPEEFERRLRPAVTLSGASVPMERVTDT